MKKRFLLLTLIMCLFGGVMPLNVMAQEVTIPSDLNVSITDDIHFIDTYNKASVSQQYYTSSELGVKTGEITHITFYTSSVYKGNTSNTFSGSITRNLQIYLKEDNSNSSFTNNKTIALDATNDKYYEGNVTLGENSTIEIQLSKPFNYNGKELLICVISNNDEWTDYRVNYKTFTGDNRVVYNAGSNPYDVTKEIPGSINGISNNVPKITFTFTNTGNDTPTAPALVSPAHDATISGTTVDLSWSYGENNTATHYKVSLGTDNENLPVITDGWVKRTELGTGGFATEDEFPNVNLEYGKTYYWRVDVKNGEEGTPVEGAKWSFATPASAAFEFTTEGNWNEGANWNGGAVPGNGAIVTLNANATITAEDNITVADLFISENASLTINGSLNITGKFSNTDASKLVINDGGQIFQKNAGVKATFNMSINNPTEWSENNIDGWQFISSPFTDASISDFVTTGDGNDYDLYKFDGKQVGAEWQNQKAIATFDTQFVPGRGYLASYESKKDVSVSGTLRNELTMNYTFGDYQYNVDLKDFHLVGNPFPFDMDMSKLYNMTYNIIEGYAVVNNGSYSYYNLEGTIPAGDGFFVKATGRDATFYYDHNAKSSRSGNANSLNITASGNAGNDNVVVNFNGEGEGFPKLQNFNDAIATVYVQNNDVNYAIFNCNEDVQEIELCFNANQMGNYTISAQAEGKFETLTLVDRFTGIETNLLVEDYRFTAMSEENNNRFFIRLGNGQQTTDNSNFAYVLGEDLIIEAEGTVQIIDMMGRVVYTSEVENNNRINVSDFNNGAYVVRVINESEIKVEKVVIY